jgi:hypothetical protein
MVSVDSFFHPVNKPPKEYYVPDHILEKPGRINLSQVNGPKLPLAGRLTEIGEQILLIGSQKAKFICTGNWGSEISKQKGSAQSSERPGFRKITNFNAFDYAAPKASKSVSNNVKVPEVERLQKALKEGRITPLDSRRVAKAEDKASQFEVKYSPER